MTTGQHREKSEVIDLENPASNCNHYLPYPVESGTWSAVGGLLYGDTPFVCGGHKNQGSNCYVLGNNTVQATLSHKR